MAEFDCPRPVTVSVRLAGGSLDVVAEERDTALVVVEPYDSSDAGREAAAMTQVDLRGDTLTVVAPETGRGWGLRHSARLRVDVRVPVGSTVDARSASAALNCHGQYATIRLSTASGACYAERATGDVSIDTASGAVRLGTVDGDIRVKGASAAMSVGYVGGDARLSSASGAIEIEEAGASVRAETASGAVRLGRVRRGRVRIETVSGRASVGVTAGTGVWLDLRTLSGGTSSDLRVGGEAPASGYDLELRVRTVSGDIDVHRIVADTPPEPEPEPEPERNGTTEDAASDDAGLTDDANTEVGR